MRILFFLILALPQIVNADVFVRSPFFFPVNPTDYKNMLSSYEPLKDVSTSHIDQLTIASPYKSSIYGIDFSFGASTQLVPQAETGKFSFTIDISQAKATIANVVTNDQVQKVVGATTVTVYLNGQCSGLHLTSSSSNLKISGDLQVSSSNGRLAFQMGQFDISGAATWNIQTDACIAPQGYQAILESTIVSMMQDNSNLRDMVNQSLSSALSKMSDQLNTQVLNVMSTKLTDGVNLTITPASVSLDSQTGWLMIQGEIAAQMTSKNNSDATIPAALTDADSAFVASSGLLMSQDFIQAVMKKMSAEGYLKYSFSSDKVSSIKTLLTNRFYQFFLWSDLLRFATNTVFQFQAASVSAPSMKWLAEDKGYLFYSLASNMRVDMMAPKNGVNVPYMNFTSAVNVTSWLAVSQGRMYMGFYPPAMQMKAAWDAGYVAQYHPSQYINTSFFNDQIKKAVGASQFNIVLPKMKLSNVSLTPQGFKSSDKWMQLVYQPVAN